MKLFFALLIAGTYAHADLATDRASIKAMSGCYKVNFDFKETFNFQKVNPFISPEYHEHGLEWVELDRDTTTSLSLQHILITGGPIVKHWRQQWDYEATALLQYQGDLFWKTTNMTPADASGRWIQRVYQVDDGPRYECSAPWIHWGTKSYWECQTWAPLPRREFSIRNDYNVVSRRNRHEITSTGWLQEEDNGKLLVVNGAVTPVAQEKGYNTYTRVADSECQAARDWWKTNKRVWNDIQDMWAYIWSHHPDIKFVGKVNGVTLWQRLFELADKYSALSTYDSNALKKEAHDVIHEYFASHE